MCPQALTNCCLTHFLIKKKSVFFTTPNQSVSATKQKESISGGMAKQWVFFLDAPSFDYTRNGLPFVFFVDTAWTNLDRFGGFTFTSSLRMDSAIIPASHSSRGLSSSIPRYPTKHFAYSCANGGFYFYLLERVRPSEPAVSTASTNSLSLSSSYGGCETYKMQNSQFLVCPLLL